MYESWYGFTEKPFNLTPDPKYLYLSQRHSEAFAHLEFGHRERGGFILITGEVGTGKTTLARYFLSKLGPDTRTAVVLYPALTAAELLRSILDDLHVTASGDSLKSLVDALHGFLLESRAAGRNVVLLIDEAQDLSAEVLEQVRLISNLETDTEKLIQIVLMGQSELRDLLARHDLRQLAQRVTARYHLTPLDRAETEAYVRHRISVAGGDGKVAFSTEALRAVHRLSGGIPRLVNLICDRALLAGYVRGSRTIGREMVKRATTEVRGGGGRPPLRWHHGVIATGLTLAIALAAFALAPRSARAPGVAATPGPSDAPAAGTRPAAPSTGAPVPSRAFEDLLRQAPRDASFQAAVERVQASWGNASLTRTTLRTHLDHLRAFDLPAILEMFHPSRRDTCFAALLGLDESRAIVSVGTSPDMAVPRSQLDDYWTRDAVVLWPEAEETRSVAGARRELLSLGYAEADLRDAVRRFQRDVELVPDGLLGPRTRMGLFAASSAPRPRLSARGERP